MDQSGKLEFDDLDDVRLIYEYSFKQESPEVDEIDVPTPIRAFGIIKAIDQLGLKTEIDAVGTEAVIDTIGIEAMNTVGIKQLKKKYRNWKKRNNRST